MQLFIFLIIPVLLWSVLFFTRVRRLSGGYLLRQLGISLVVAVVLVGSGYLIGTFTCNGSRFCQTSFLARSLLIASLELGLWAAVLFIRKRGPSI